MRKIGLCAALVYGLTACSDVPTASVPARPVPLRPSASSPATSGVPIPNQYIVRFRDTEANVSARGRSIEGLYGATVEREYIAAIKGVLVRLADAGAQALASDPNVVSIEQDQTVSLYTTQTGATWGLDRIDQRNLPLSTTYSYTPDGTGVTVYIIDTGINFTHTEYSGRAFTGIDEVTPGGTATDCNGHGSHVSGTVGGTTYGVAKKVKLVAVRVLDCGGTGTFGGVIAGIDWVRLNRALPAVANMSLGGAFSSSLNAAVDNAIASGVVFAVAAGNSSGNACNESPSSAANALTVGATTISDGFAFFSNFGSCVDLNAPGVNITSAWIGSATATNTISGTSMASPHVAGAAALYLQTNPSATPAQVRTALVGNATPNVITSLPAATPNLLLYTGFLAAPLPPVARFTSSCASFTCAFDGSTSTALASATYAWTFGDGANATGKLTNHVYSAAGSYSVTLTVTDANGSNSKTSSVTVPVVGNQPPVANFTVVCPALQCTADGSSSTDDVGIVDYAWTWGNGTGEHHPFPISKKTYAAAGTYNITLTVKDGSGLTNSITKAVRVPTSSNQSPTATITAPANNASFVQGTSVTFAGSGVDPEDGTLTGSSLVWTSSRDGQIGTGVSFSTTTLSVGIHTITLTAKDAQNNVGTATRTITITTTRTNQPPVARFTWNCTGFNPHQCLMDASTSSDDVGIVSYAWTWGNGRGETNVGAATKNTWAAAGVYSVTLTVTDGGGLTSNVTQSVTVP